jgi:hypothetical protein
MRYWLSPNPEKEIDSPTVSLSKETALKKDIYLYISKFVTTQNIKTLS